MKTKPRKRPVPEIPLRPLVDFRGRKLKPLDPKKVERDVERFCAAVDRDTKRCRGLNVGQY